MPVKAALRKDPYQNFRFRVEIDGIIQSGFSEVILPESFVDVVEFRTGADSVTSSRKIPGRVHYGNLILTDGVSNSLELYNWWRMVEQGLAGNARKNISVILMNEDGTDASRWEFTNAWPVRIKYSKLKATGNEIAVEILEIAVEIVRRVL